MASKLPSYTRDNLTLVGKMRSQIAAAAARYGVSAEAVAGAARETPTAPRASMTLQAERMSLVAMLIDRLSGLFHASPWKRCCLKGMIVLAMLALASGVSCAAQRTIEWFDEESCPHKIRFDAAKYDESHLKNTVEFIFAGYLHNFPVPQGFTGFGAASVDKFRAACTRHSELLQSLQLVELPRIEDYRRLKLDQLREWCDFGEALIRGTLSDTAALRSFNAGKSACSRYPDALEGKSDLKQTWRNLVIAICAKNSNPVACRSDHWAAEQQPDATDRIRSDLLTYGWQNCTAEYLKMSEANPVGRQARSLERELEVKFRARFRMTGAPCD